MKKFLKIVLAAALLFAVCVPAWANRPPMTRAQHNRNKAYNKNYLPPGWQYEAGYAVWRMNRKAPLNRNTYRRYKNDKAWHSKMRRYYRPQELALNTVDWTVEEVAFFLDRYQDLLKFHPAGFE
ncbi:MAG: hypothetical protein FWG71_06450 [Synergistaceae bacterium]|nr:hypothetical protein [Synergistaceae bacterium]